MDRETRKKIFGDDSIQVPLKLNLWIVSNYLQMNTH